jgi:hypothetical protein
MPLVLIPTPLSPCPSRGKRGLQADVSKAAVTKQSGAPAWRPSGDASWAPTIGMAQTDAGSPGWIMSLRTASGPRPAGADHGPCAFQSAARLGRSYLDDLARHRCCAWWNATAAVGAHPAMVRWISVKSSPIGQPAGALAARRSRKADGHPPCALFIRTLPPPIKFKFRTSKECAPFGTAPLP